MSGFAVAVVLTSVFIYIELAVGVGYYMYLRTAKKEEDAAEEKKQIKKYSIIAGAAFPITLAIIIASKAAERG